MIFSLKGKVIYKEKDFLVLQVNQIGYQVFIGESWVKKIKINEVIEVFTYLYLRQETQELYGFANLEELEFFKKLLAIVGVGPKLAQGILSLTSLIDLKKAIATGQINLLTRVPGVGRKTAQKIIIDLQGKIDDIFKKEEREIHPTTVKALIHLGYQLTEIKQAFKEIPETIKEPQEQIKLALKILAKK